MLFVSSKTGIRGEESQVTVDQLEGITSRTGGKRRDAGMGGSHDVTEWSHLESSMAQYDWFSAQTGTHTDSMEILQASFLPKKRNWDHNKCASRPIMTVT
jgi:hypothetical protein